MPASRQGNHLAGFVKFWLPVLVWMGFIFYSSSIPGEDIPPLFPYQDIVYHIAIYALLAYLFARAIKNTYSNIAFQKIIFFSVAFGFIYGFSDEIHQMFVPGRFASGLDLLIDSTGSFIGSLFKRK